MIPNVVDQIDGLIRSVHSEAVKLIKENDARIKNGVTTAVASGFVPWADFETEATSRLGFSSLGWKQEFERQIALTEGALTKWFRKGEVPLGFFNLCSIIVTARSVSVPTPKKTRWSDEENVALRELHALHGQDTAPIRAGMQKRFGNRRDYTKKGTIYGQMNRLGLSVSRT